MEGRLVPANGRRKDFNFHPDRNKLLAEAHARPYTPLQSPTLATRLAAISLEENDWAHMVTLCRRLGVAEPSREARWCVVDSGSWRLRWERHTEFSTWTFYRPLGDDIVPAIETTALDLVPQDWLGELPGEILVASHIILLRKRPTAVPISAQDEIAAHIMDGMAEVFTDFRPGPDLFTRMHLIQPAPDAVLAGRLVSRLFEIETYRLLAMLAFPLAGQAGALLSSMEAEVALADLEVSKQGSIEADRELLKRLSSLAGEAQALSGRTSFRFAAARAYYGLVQERIEQLRESRLEGRPTIAEFMERRLAPAMRTCVAVSERLQGVIDHIFITSQLLSTRVDVAAEITNASLLASVDRRARLQLRLQQTVEGLSVAAISYYALGLLGYAFKAISDLAKNFDPTFATGVAAPFVIVLVWWALNRARRRMLAEERARDAHGSAVQNS